MARAALPCFKAIFLLDHPHRDLERPVLLDIDTPDLILVEVPSLVISQPARGLPSGLRRLHDGVLPREELWAEGPSGHHKGSSRGSKAYVVM